MKTIIQNVEFLGSNPEITGINNNIIKNQPTGSWDFDGASLINCTITASDQFSKLTTTKFVHADFTVQNNFYKTIQAAIDSILDSSINKIYNIFVFSGDYDGFKITEKSYINIHGVGDVFVKTPLDADNWLYFENSSNCSIINMGIIGSSIGSNIIKLTNSSINFNKFNINFNIEEINDFNKNIIFGILTNENIIFENCEFKISQIINIPNKIGKFRFMLLNSNNQNISIENCLFKYSLKDNTDTLDGEFYFIKNEDANLNKYFMKINNCKFCLLFGGLTSPVLMPIESDLESVGNIFVSNSFSNLTINDLTKQTNNFEDTYYII